MSFESKAKVEEYIRGLKIKSAIFAPGSFMQNFASNIAPYLAGDGTYAMANFVSPQTKLPCIDTVDDTGKYIGAILANPDEFEGKVLSASTDTWTFEEIAQVMSKASGKTVKYNQLPLGVWKGSCGRGVMEIWWVCFSGLRSLGIMRL